MKIVRFLGLALLAVLLAGGVLLYRAMRPYQGFQGTVYVDLPHGTGTRAMAELLAQNGVIGSEWDFFLPRLIYRGRRLQAGEYRFNAPASAFDVAGRIARGDIFFYELVVPEGKNIFDIGAAAEQLGAFPAADFVKAAMDPALIRDLDPQAPSLEGYLFPETYRINRHTTPQQLCKQMTDSFRRAWRGLGTAEDVHQTITMASLIEKESKLTEERPRVSAVFTNRLRIGMKLDCDPTTIYAAQLLGVYRGTIYRSDLDRSHPYNTYSHAGLPPGPIANPGVASIQAALHPADTQDLYFVLRPDNSGGHQFSTNITAHEAATERYRRALHNR